MQENMVIFASFLSHPIVELAWQIVDVLIATLYVTNERNMGNKQQEFCAFLEVAQALGKFCPLQL